MNPTLFRIPLDVDYIYIVYYNSVIVNAHEQIISSNNILQAAFCLLDQGRYIAFLQHTKTHNFSFRGMFNTNNI